MVTPLQPRQFADWLMEEAARGAGVPVEFIRAARHRAGDLEEIVTALQAGRYDCTDEYRLQDGCAQVLTAAGYVVRREVSLSEADRIDLMVGQIGIECKVAGSPSAVVRQVIRYMQSPQVAALVLVTGRAAVGRMLRMSVTVNCQAKPVRVVETWRTSL